MRRTTISFLIIVAILCQQALGDQITLKNGDRLTGKIVRSDGKTLVIKTDLAGEVTVGWEDITDVTSNTPLYITLPDGRTVAGLVTTSGDQLTVRETGGGSVAATRETVKTVRSEEEQQEFLRRLNPGWLEEWSGSADLGVALSSGNSDTTNIAFGLGLTRPTANDKTSVYGAALYARDSTSGEERTVANILRGGVRYDRDINRRWFGYGAADLERNELQDLNLRFVLGGGLGYHAIRSENTQLDILGGANWNKEYFDGDFNDRSSAEAQIGQTLSHRFSPRVSLKEQFFIFPNLTETGEYRMNFDTAIVTQVTSGIGWQLTLSDRYLSNPPFGLEKNDLLLTTGITVKIGR